MAHITPADQYVTCDLAFFFIEEIELLGNTVFSASGVLESVSAAPALAAAWLIGSGLYGCRFVYLYEINEGPLCAVCTPSMQISDGLLLRIQRNV